MSINAAREQARVILQRVRAGLSPVERKGETFDAVAENWLKRHVDAKGLRSVTKSSVCSTATCGRYGVIANSYRSAAPTWRRCSTKSKMIIRARQADAVLTVIRSMMNWFATRHDDYQPPIVRGMRRQSPQAQARARVLDDTELRAIWKAAEPSGAFGAVVCLLLLTAQRRHKVINMQWSELDGNEWTIPREPREKDNAGVLALPDAAMAIIQARPKLGDNPFVFAGRGDGPINGFSKSKSRLDQASGVSGWRLHDLRRTARSLLSRSGVSSDHAERVMGHAIGGVEGIYDRHAYKDEKAMALEKLAALIDGIVNPRDNVTPMVRAKHR